MKKRERDLIISSLRKTGLTDEELETAKYMGKTWCLGNIFKLVRQCLSKGGNILFKQILVVKMTHWCIYLLYILNKEEKDAERVLTDSKSI